LIGAVYRTILGREAGEQKAKIMGQAARVELESLLRARKLDITLTTSAPWITDEELRAETGIAAVDAALGGGLRRGHLSEITGPRSSGRTTLLCHTLAAAAARGELTALVDVCDRFDPVSAQAAGVDLATFLWVRDTGDLGRAIKAMNLILQAGGFGIVALDLVDVPTRVIRQVPYTTWIRLARAIEGSQIAALVVGAERTARSPGGVTISLDPSSGRWTGQSDRSRLLYGVDLRPRVIAARG
jgi:recombination protein RecA